MPDIEQGGRVRKINFRVWITTPYFWTLLTTPFPPFNVVCATAFWLAANLLRTPARAEAARCLNAQVTFTLLFALPIAIAFGTAMGENADDPESSYLMLYRLATGFPLGLISLVAILTLALFNLHIFASRVTGNPSKEIPRFKFVSEKASS